MIDIIKKSDCCGCTACYNACSKHAITMQADELGFLYPHINIDNCVNCGLCEKVCPILIRKSGSIIDSQPIAYAVRNNRADEYMHSSSGGFFSILSRYVICEKKGVVFGVRYNEKMEVVHDYAETMDECSAFRGSKYVQSDIQGILPQVKAFLKQGRYVLFSGTPCQVEGLKGYLGKHYINLLTVDLVCHAVPSPQIFKDYVSYINELSGDKLQSINMRYKGGNGWGHSFSYLYEFKSGRKEVNWSKVQPWGRLYFPNLITRDSCHECKFCNTNRSGDFTIADYWDDNNLHPEAYSKNGTSLVLLNSEVARTLLPTIIDGAFSIKIPLADAMQHCLIAPFPAYKKYRDEFAAYYLHNGFVKAYNRYFTSSLFMKRRNMFNQLKSIIKKILRHG